MRNLLAEQVCSQGSTRTIPAAAAVNQLSEGADRLEKTGS
jgi:hypothetical protein